MFTIKKQFWQKTLDDYLISDLAIKSWTFSSFTLQTSSAKYFQILFDSNLWIIFSFLIISWILFYTDLHLAFNNKSLQY